MPPNSNPKFSFYYIINHGTGSRKPSNWFDSKRAKAKEHRLSGQTIQGQAERGVFARKPHPQAIPIYKDLFAPVRRARLGSPVEDCRKYMENQCPHDVFAFEVHRRPWLPERQQRYRRHSPEFGHEHARSHPQGNPAQAE